MIPAECKAEWDKNLPTVQTLLLAYNSIREYEELEQAAMLIPQV